MNIEREDGKNVVINASEGTASDLLAGLEAHREEFGELGAQLARMLRDAGIHPPAEPDHVRYEYMPPAH
ncbi:MAG: hypothetical protein P8Y64_01680 [Gammaproteobacteria bacterium]|jgi:uncharacterized protein involved in exopolysaccharide biosynthesis